MTLPLPSDRPQPADAQSASLGSAPLAAAQDRFVATWGQMGATWGISRTMAEVHALLYICGAPLCTDDVMDRLAISRGNASMSLRSLVDWGLIARIHKRGDRKEYFEAEQDVWALVQAVVRERMKREVQPVLQALYELRDQTDPARVPRTRSQTVAALTGDEATVIAHNQRLDSMIGLIKLIEQMGDKLSSLRPEQLRDLAGALSEQAGIR